MEWRRNWVKITPEQIGSEIYCIGYNQKKNEKVNMECLNLEVFTHEKNCAIKDVLF